MQFLLVAILFCLLQISLGAKEVREISESSGTIRSLYPKTYPDDLDITWKITVNPGRRIFLNFTDFDLENSYDADLGGPCVYDYLEIKEKNKVIRRYCGNREQHIMDAPSPHSHIESCGNSLTLQLISDYSNVDPLPKGFEAFFREIGVTCDRLGDPKNGEVKASTSPPYEIGTTLSYSCNEGHALIGRNRIVCLQTGSWSQPPPVCSAAGCSAIEKPEHGAIAGAEGPPYQIGTVLTFSCDRGFRLHGKDTTTCQEGGTWSDLAPVCFVTTCKRDRKKVKGRECRKSCDDDDECSGENKKCICDGWCGKICFNPDADCPTPVAPVNGYVENSDRKYAGKAIYKCNNGYTINGNRYRTCQSDRQWSGEIPKCVPYDTCGQAGDVGDVAHIARVGHGSNAYPGAWPWQVLLLEIAVRNIGKIPYRSSIKGGGSVINEKWVLTAAHVFNYSRNLQTDKDDVLLVLGATHLPKKGSFFPDHVRIHKIDKLILNSQYNSHNYDYDVSLMRIGHRVRKHGNEFVVDISSTEISFSEYIRPVCLPCIGEDGLYDQKGCARWEQLLKSATAKGKNNAVVTGFGHTYNVDSIPFRLQQGALRVLPNDRCENTAMQIRSDPEYSQATFTERMLCATSFNESLLTDACQGDSGGPLVREFYRDSRYSYFQIGIVSWGKGCGEEYPGFYVSVTSIMEWIHTTFRSYK